MRLFTEHIGAPNELRAPQGFRLSGCQRLARLFFLCGRTILSPKRPCVNAFLEELLMAQFKTIAGVEDMKEDPKSAEEEFSPPLDPGIAEYVKVLPLGTAMTWRPGRHRRLRRCAPTIACSALTSMSSATT